MATSVSDLPSEMWAANVKEFKKPWVLEKIPVPAVSLLEPHDILIKVAVASLCHTDMMVLNGAFHDEPSGLAGSHEPSGTIVALGAKAAENFALNERVIAIGIRGPCGDCMDCNGPEEYQLTCKFTKGYAGISLPGAFQEYTVVDERFTVQVPDSMSFVKAAPLTCAGCTSWRAVLRANVRPGGWLGIVGSGGGLGHLAIQFAAGNGVNVIGIEARDTGLELTKKAGAKAALDIRKGLDSVTKEVREIIGTRTLGRGDDFCDATIVLSDAKSAVSTAMAITICHGLVVQVAQPERIDFPFQEMIFRDIRIMGSNLSSRSELADQVRFVADKGVNIETKVFNGLESLQEAYDLIESGNMAGKIVIAVDPDQE